MRSLDMMPTTATKNQNTKNSQNASNEIQNASSETLAGATPLVVPGNFGRDSAFLAVVLGTALGALTLWCAFDHSLPSWDAAGHLLNGLSYRDLIRHPKLFDLNWYHQLLTVNCFYPPLTYVFAGLVKTVLGTALWTDSLIKLVYLGVMGVSVYGLVNYLTKDKLAAAFSVALINLYPEVAIESHKSMLDFSVMAMTSVSLFALVWFNEKQTWRRAAVLALAIAAALLTKQVCAAFLLLPCAAVFFNALRKRQFKTAGMIATAGIAAASTLIPWLIVSAPTIKKVAAEIQVALGNKSVSEVFFGNVVAYFSFLPLMMTPVLLGIAIIGFLFAKKETHKQLFILALALVSAAVLLSTLTWQYALPRYFLAALILPAAYTGCALSELWRSKQVFARLAAVSLLLVGTIGYVAVNFYPYPIASTPVLHAVRSISLRPVVTETSRRYEHPLKDENWGVLWALEQIKKTDGDTRLWLNVLPSTHQLNVHTFEYYARQGKFAVMPTTSRTWSAAGDSTQFQEKDALNYQWYAIKTGEQGFKFQSPKSKANFDEWVAFITSGGKFTYKGELNLPDGSVLILYRQN